MPRSYCHRDGCTRIRSEFNLFLTRRRPPRYEGKTFCSDDCLRMHFEKVLIEKWRNLQAERNRHFPRPKLGTILMQSACITRDQLDQAIRLQAQAREGRIGEWLQRLGFVEEHQVTEALARQYRLPMINIKASDAKVEAVRMIPGQVARCTGLVPVGFDDDQMSLRVAVTAPVNFVSHEAIRRMVGRSIVPYIGDQSVVQELLERIYGPDDLDLSGLPTFSSLEELIEAGKGIIGAAINQRANDVRAELVPEFLWVRIDFANESHHHLFRYAATAAELGEQSAEHKMAVGYGT